MALNSNDFNLNSDSIVWTGGKLNTLGKARSRMAVKIVESEDNEELERMFVEEMEEIVSVPDQTIVKVESHMVGMVMKIFIFYYEIME